MLAPRWPAFHLESWPVPARIGFDVGLSAGTGMAMTLAGVLLPALFHRSGIGGLGLAAFSAAPLFGGLLALQFSSIFQVSGKRVALVRAASSALFCLLPFVPSAIGLSLWCLVTIVNSVLSPLQHHVWGVLYSQSRRMQYVGLGRLVGTALSLVLVTGGSRLAEQIGGLTIVALAGLCGVLASGCYLAIPFQAAGATARPSATLQAVRDFWRHPALRRLFNAHLLFGFGMTAASPLYTLRQIDSYHMSLGQLGVLSGIGTVCGAVSGPLWGRIADRVHGGWVMTAGAICLAVGPWCYVGSLPVIWLYVAAASMAAGITAIDMGLTAVYSATVPLEQRPKYSAAWSALTGARGLLAPFLTGWLSQSGLVTTAQLLGGCAAIMGAGALAYLRAVAPAAPAVFRELPAALAVVSEAA